LFFILKAAWFHCQESVPNFRSRFKLPGNIHNPAAKFGATSVLPAKMALAPPEAGQTFQPAHYPIKILCVFL
jgi:hypothetical protein